MSKVDRKSSYIGTLPSLMAGGPVMSLLIISFPCCRQRIEWILHKGSLQESKWNKINKITSVRYSAHWSMSMDFSLCIFMWYSVQFSCSVVSDSLQPHGLQHTRPPYPSPTPGVYSNSCPSSQWCHPTISSFVVLFSSCLQSFPASGSFPLIQFFTSDGQSIGVSASASVLPMNIQDWFPLG